MSRYRYLFLDSLRFSSCLHPLGAELENKGSNMGTHRDSDHNSPAVHCARQRIPATLTQTFAQANPHSYRLSVIGSLLGYGLVPFTLLFNAKQRVLHGFFLFSPGGTNHALSNREYRVIFTTVILPRKITACLGSNGNQFVLDDQLRGVNAEEIYSILTGKDAISDVPNADPIEQTRMWLCVRQESGY